MVPGAAETDGRRTLVLKEVAHARAASKDELRDVLDDLGLVLGRQRNEPLGEALGRCQRARG